MNFYGEVEAGQLVPVAVERPSQVDPLVGLQVVAVGCQPEAEAVAEGVLTALVRDRSDCSNSPAWPPVLVLGEGGQEPARL